MQKWQDYSASALWMLGRIVGGEIWSLQSYIEFAYPEKVTDNRTTAQIKEYILGRLAE